MWTTIGKLFVKAAAYCLGHPDQVIVAVNEIKQATGK